MATICLRLTLEPFLSLDVINIIISYATINCNNCKNERTDIQWNIKYKKCNGWLCIECDKKRFSRFYPIYL